MKHLHPATGGAQARQRVVGDVEAAETVDDRLHGDAAGGRGGEPILDPAPHLVVADGVAGEEDLTLRGVREPFERLEGGGAVGVKEAAIAAAGGEETERVQDAEVAPSRRHP